MRRQALHYERTFLQALADQAEVQHLEVPETTMDQLARPTRGARGPVLCLDKAHREPARRSVEGNAGARYPASYDEDIQLPAAQARDVVASTSR
jgi:hypothetical protein